MSKGTLTSLDFVISVLREHEKELTLLSDKLEDAIGSVSGENVKKDMDEIKDALKALRQEIRALDEKASASSSLNSSTEFILKQLERQASIQNQTLSLLIEAMRNFPTKKEMEDLRASISSLNSLMQRLVPKAL